MVERDEDGRPIATRNAGAFMGPFGMYPVPSNLLDDRSRATPRKRGRSRRFKVVALAIVTIVVIVVFLLLAAATPSTASGLPTQAFALSF
jgi:hypothetical protein